MKKIFDDSERDNFFDHMVFMLQVPLVNGTSKERPNKFDEKILQVTNCFLSTNTLFQKSNRNIWFDFNVKNWPRFAWCNNDLIFSKFWNGDAPSTYFLQMGQSRPLFSLSFSHCNNNYSFNFQHYKLKKTLIVYLGLEPRPKDGRHRQNHGAMTAAQMRQLIYLTTQFYE